MWMDWRLFVQIKRVDRLRILTVWKYCDRINSKDRICEGNYSVNGVPKPQPRTWMDNVYGRNITTTFWGVSCANATEGITHLTMKCPEGYSVMIDKANYGRYNAYSCTGPGNKFAPAGSCMGNEISVKKKAQEECMGKQICSFHGKPNRDPCPGVSKYTAIKWYCEEMPRLY